MSWAPFDHQSQLRDLIEPSVKFPEGVTETAQQSLERLQAKLEMMSPEAVQDRSVPARRWRPEASIRPHN